MDIQFYLHYTDAIDCLWLHGKRTVIALMIHREGILHDIILDHLSTDETIDECKTHEQDFIDIMLKNINEKIKRSK